MTIANPVYVALDTTDAQAAARLATSLYGNIHGIKLGLEFFIANGPAGVETVVERSGMPLFLDLKLHDIPNTVAGGMRSILSIGPGKNLVGATTIHASGGPKMIEAARMAAEKGALEFDKARPTVLAVTILTSIDQQTMNAIGIPGEVLDAVRELALMAKDTGADGVVCSPHEVAVVRAACGPDFKIVVPGIRPAWAEAGDQKRIKTPSEAMAEGADFLVIGRPITEAADPAAAARRIADEVGA